MVTTTNATISEIQQTGHQGLITHLMVVTHFAQKNTLDKLMVSQRYEKLSLAYEGYISLLAERDYSPGELAAKLQVSKQVCSKSLRELEKLDLIERRKNPQDNRSSVLSLTQKGLQLLQDGLEATNEIHQQFAEQLGSEPMAQLTEILVKLCQQFSIDLPSYETLAQISRKSSGVEPSRLNAILAKLNSYFRQTLLQSLVEKGYQGLKSSFGQVLGSISREPRRIQYIASILGISRQAVAVSGAELEQLGYATREPDPADKRQIILHLSPLGKQLMRDSQASVSALEAVIKERLSEAEFRLLDDAMANLYFFVAGQIDTPNVLRAKIQQLSEYLLEELGVTGAHALAQQLLTITRGKQ